MEKQQLSSFHGHAHLGHNYGIFETHRQFLTISRAAASMSSI
jgi:hypothetical protein